MYQDPKHWQCQDLRKLFEVANEYNNLQKFVINDIDFATTKMYSILNVCWQDFSSENLDQHDIGDRVQFCLFTKQVLSRNDKIELINSQEVINLIKMEPHIQDNKILEENRFGKYKNPSIEHDNLILAYSNFVSNHDNVDMVVNNLCRTLYTVRCNLMHGLKTPHGIDKEKAERDKAVCDIVYPILRLLFNYYFNFPDKRLVSYGILKEIISSIDGMDLNWVNGEIFGNVESIEGIFYFNQNLNDRTPAFVGLSNRAIDFSRVDYIEGNRYQRILTPVKINEKLLLCNVYVKK